MEKEKINHIIAEWKQQSSENDKTVFFEKNENQYSLRRQRCPFGAASNNRSWQGANTRRRLVLDLGFSKIF